MKNIIYFDVKKSIFSSCTWIAHTQKGICAILFGWDQDDELERMFPNAEIKWAYSPQYALKIIKKLENFDAADIPIDLCYGTEFQKSVWQEISKIPHGKTITYSELAQNIKKPKTIRAVASACGKNPLSILIPCHRVVPKTGGVGRYRWDDWDPTMKKKLLDLENNKN